MRGGQHPHVHRNLFIAADALDVFFLEHAQQLDLGAQAQVANLIEEDGAEVGLLEAADPPGVRAGVSAAFVAEQFAFQQRLRDGRAIHRDERLVGAFAVLVNRPRHQFLARAGFAANEHGDGSGGHTPDFLVDGLHGAAVADDGGLGGVGFAHFQWLGHEAAAGHGFGDEIEQFAHIKRFEEIVVGAKLGGFNGGFGRAESSHHDDGKFRLGGVELLDQFEAGQAWHLQIGEHYIARVFLGEGQSIIAARGHGDLVAFGLQLLFQRRCNAGVVFDQQDFRLRVH